MCWFLFSVYNSLGATENRLIALSKSRYSAILPSDLSDSHIFLYIDGFVYVILMPGDLHVADLLKMLL